MRPGQPFSQIPIMRTAAVIVISIICTSCIKLYAQGYDDTFEIRNKLKIELQYADYGEYEYPEPILYQYGIQDYKQNLPYVANFPEKRALIKFTRMVKSAAALSMKYQMSDMREDVNQHMGELKWTENFGGIIGLIGMQFIRDTRGFNMYQPGIGLRWDISLLSIFQGDLQYYARGRDAAPIGGSMGSWNVRLKFRQVLTISTAMYIEYLHYNSKGETLDFRSHIASVWLSQFLPTQTALHCNLRLYTNSLGIESIAPSIEIAQYLNWATILRIKYRYYTNRSDNVHLGEEEVIIPDGLNSNSFSVQLNRELNPDMLLYIKYRYYKSNQQIQMNTYLTGMVFSF
ncbi:hypothetical protein BVY01_05005 [bacterium I07]|nr:hypothetical protein BVY01_05005 [bacterium I07]